MSLGGDMHRWLRCSAIRSAVLPKPLETVVLASMTSSYDIARGHHPLDQFSVSNRSLAQELGIQTAKHGCPINKGYQQS